MLLGNDTLTRNILRMVRPNLGRLLRFGLIRRPFVFFIEIYCYLRSPYRDLGVYDSVVQVRTQCNRDDMCAHG
jgi:hypothetical protein